MVDEDHDDPDDARVPLRQAGKSEARKSALRLEAEQAAADPDDLAEARRVRATMDEFTVERPERSQTIDKIRQGRRPVDLDVAELIREDRPA